MTTTDDLTPFTLEGSDRDCAAAMLSQARLPHASRVDDTQVKQLLAIGYRAGRQVTEDDAAFDTAESRFSSMQWAVWGFAAGAMVTGLLEWLLG